jgi:hypothetical protein
VTGQVVLQPPAPNAPASEPSLAATVALLQALLANASSILYKGPAGRYLLPPSAQFGGNGGAGGNGSGGSPPVTYTPAGTRGGMLLGRLNMSVVLSDVLTMAYGFDGDYLTVELTFTGGDAWFGIAFNDAPSMVGGDAITVEPGLPAGTRVRHYLLHSRSSSGLQRIQDGVAFLESQATVNTSALVGGKRTTVARFARSLAGAYYGGKDVDPAGKVVIVFAHGAPGETLLGPHARSTAGAATVDLPTGAVARLGLALRPLVIAHAVLMTVAWGVLAPLAILIARYSKGKAPTTGPAAWWFVNHWRLQVAACCLFVAAFVMGVVATPAGGHFASFHQIAGLIVVVLGLLQPALGNKFVRPAKAADGAPASMARRVWEAQHMGCGYVALLLSVAVVFTGIRRADAGGPTGTGALAGTIVFAIWVGVVGVAALVLEMRTHGDAWLSALSAAQHAARTAVQRACCCACAAAYCFGCGCCSGEGKKAGDGACKADWAARLRCWGATAAAEPAQPSAPPASGAATASGAKKPAAAPSAPTPVPAPARNPAWSITPGSGAAAAAAGAPGAPGHGGAAGTGGSWLVQSLFGGRSAAAPAAPAVSRTASSASNSRSDDGAHDEEAGTPATARGRSAGLPPTGRRGSAATAITHTTGNRGSATSTASTATAASRPLPSRRDSTGTTTAPPAVDTEAGAAGGWGSAVWSYVPTWMGGTPAPGGTPVPGAPAASSATATPATTRR